jgi:hypothetical protein
VENEESYEGQQFARTLSQAKYLMGRYGLGAMEVIDGDIQHSRWRVGPLNEAMACHRAWRRAQPTEDSVD